MPELSARRAKLRHCRGESNAASAPAMRRKYWKPFRLRAGSCAATRARRASPPPNWRRRSQNLSERQALSNPSSKRRAVRAALASPGSAAPFRGGPWQQCNPPCRARRYEFNVACAPGGFGSGLLQLAMLQRILRREFLSQSPNPRSSIWLRLLGALLVCNRYPATIRGGIPPIHQNTTRARATLVTRGQDQRT